MQIASIVFLFINAVLALPVNYYEAYQNMYYPPPPPPGYYQGPPNAYPSPPPNAYPSPPPNAYPSPPPNPSTLPSPVTWDQFSECLNKVCQDDLDECIPQCMEPSKPKDDKDKDHDKDSPKHSKEEA